MHTATESSHSYRFQQDFSAIATPGLHRYLKERGYDPDEPSNEIDDCWESGKDYVAGLFRSLKSAQSDYRDFGASPDLEVYAIEGWSHESVAAYVAQRLDGILADVRSSVTWEDVVATGQRLDHEHAAAEKSFIEQLRAVAKTTCAAEPPRAVARLPSALDAVTIGRGADWTDVGGVLAKMRDHVLATAPYPNRPLATMSALATLSAVCGSRVYSPTGLTLSLYLVMLAETGEGKDAALKAPARFLHSANLGPMAQPGKTFTVSGFEQCLIDSRGACVATCDEIGESLLKKVLSKKAMSSETAIKTFLMELSGREDHNPPFALTKRAANGVDGDNIVHSIPGASFTLFGASTPSAFYEALTYGNVGDGSLNRFLVINADPAPEDENIVDRIVPVPQAVSDALEGIAATSAGITFAGGRAWPLIESERAAWAPKARERYEILAKQMRAVLRSKPQFAELYARVKANALKVATLLAVSRAVESGELLVTVDDLDKGAAMALESATVTIDGAMKHMAGSAFEDNCKTILKAVNAADDKGVTQVKLHSKPGVSKISPRDFKDAVEFLVRTGQMEAKEHPKRKGQFRYIKMGNRIAEEED